MIVVTVLLVENSVVVVVGNFRCWKLDGLCVRSFVWFLYLFFLRGRIALRPRPQLTHVVSIAFVHDESRVVLGHFDAVTSPVLDEAFVDAPELVASLTVTIVGDNLVLHAQLRFATRVVKAMLVSPDLAILAQHPILFSIHISISSIQFECNVRFSCKYIYRIVGYLIATLAVTIVRDDALAERVTVRVEAIWTGVASHLAIVERLARNELLRIDVLDEPLEALALELVAERLAIAHVSVVAQVVLDALVVVLFVVVEPHLGQSDGIFAHHVHLCGPLVRTALTEDVSHVAARCAHQLAATHPDLERDLQVFATPDFHARIIHSKCLKVFASNSEKATYIYINTIVFCCLLLNRIFAF